jgi:hypothetical protein
MRWMNDVVVALRYFRHYVLGQGVGIDNRLLPTLHEPSFLSFVSCIINSTLLATCK